MAITAENFQFDITTAWDNLSTMSIVRATNYLTYIFEAQDNEIVLGDVVTTPRQATLGSNPSLQARHMPIRFWGGPPGEEEWYEGSILALLIDRLFYNIATGNIAVVRRFQECFKKHA
jgi:hypothetical protein